MKFDNIVNIEIQQNLSFSVGEMHNNLFKYCYNHKTKNFGRRGSRFCAHDILSFALIINIQ